jgi:hypothetical protein
MGGEVGYMKRKIRLLHCNSISFQSEWYSRKQTTTNAGVDVEEKEPSYNVGGDVN